MKPIESFVNGSSKIIEIQLKKLNADKIDIFAELQQSFMNKTSFLSVCLNHSNNYISELIKENNPFSDGEVLNSYFIFVPKNFDSDELIIYTKKPQIIIGKNGQNIKKLAYKINKALNKKIIINVKRLENENKSE